MVLQELIEVEATEQIGAARYERTDTRTTDRNGSRPRLLTTQAGDIELRIPKLRKGSVLPVDPRAPPADRPGPLRGGDGGLRQRRVDPRRRRPGRGAGGDVGDQEVRGVTDLRRARRDRRRVPHPPARPHRVPLRLPGRHLPPRPQPDRAGHLDGRRDRHRDHRHRRPRSARCRHRRLRRRGVLARLPALAQVPWPGRCAAGDLRSARRPRRRPAPQLPGCRPSTLPGALRPQPAGPRPEVASGHGRRGVPHDLRPTRPGHRRRRPGTRSATSSATASPRSPC